MKAFQSILAAAIASLVTVTAPQLLAQEILGSERVVSGPLSTGFVDSVDRRNGTMVIHSFETHGPITFYGLDKARVETSTGRAASLAEVHPRMPLTVHYTPSAGRWYVGKVVIPETQIAVRPGAELTISERRALESVAANDGDLTTEPGVKARIDDDITTKPGKKDPRDPDITKKPDN